MISSCPLYLVYHQYTFHTDPPKMPKRQQMVQRRQCPRMEPVIDRLYRCQSEIFLNLFTDVFFSLLRCLICSPVLCMSITMYSICALPLFTFHYTISLLRIKVLP